MTVYSVASLVDAERNGQTFFSTWRKQPTQATTAGNWFDLSMSPGNPVPNYYIGTPGYFVPLKQSTDVGIPHGGDVAPQQKFLRMLGAQTALTTAVPLSMWLLDYLGFYPFLDESVTDEQTLYTSVAVPRFPLGEGVQMMAVVVAGQTGGLSTFTVKYTNSSGVMGRITPAHDMTIQAVNGTIISGGVYVNSRAPFLALQDGDTGVRLIESITFGGIGDIGLVTLVLVKPIARHTIRGIDAPVERDFFMEMSSIPEIKDDAYLNFIALPAGTLAAAPIYGYIKTCWI